MKHPPFLGHQSTFQHLQDMRHTDRLPHALLFTGPEGIGKQKIAQYFAKILLCAESQAPCGKCRSCLFENMENHPDYFLISPDEGKIKIDTIRQLSRKLQLSPMVSPSKVVIVVDAHAMNAAAANALLKTLEEPPTNTLFILISHALGWLPKTIASRCQKIRFSPLSVEELEQALIKEEIKIDPQMVSWGNGSPLKSIQLNEMKDQLPELKTLIKEMTPAKAWQLTQEVIEGDHLLLFLEILLHKVHQALLSGKLPTNFHFDLLTFADRILEFKRDLRLNANPKIHLSRLLLFFKEPIVSRL
jgi:DNA polymerase-3 subunit delta'